MKPRLSMPTTRSMPAPAYGVGQRVDGLAQAGRIAEQRRDVVEEDARLRKVGHVADLRFEMVHGETDLGDDEGAGMARRGQVVDDDVVHPGQRRAAPERGLEAAERVVGAFRFDLDAAIGQVATAEEIYAREGNRGHLYLVICCRCGK